MNISRWFNLKTAVESIKPAHASTGSARTGFTTLTQLVNSPFTLSATASAAVEGIRAFQLPFLDLTKSSHELY